MEEEEFEIPDPIENADGSQDWPQPEAYFPFEIVEQDIEPVEVDDDYSPAEEDGDDD